MKKSINRNNGRIRVWITSIRDLMAGKVCRTKAWLKARFVRENPVQDWFQWNRRHENYLSEILQNLSEHIPLELWNIINEADLIIAKNFPLEAQVNDTLVITGKLDALLISPEGERVAILEIKGSGTINFSHILQTRLYILALHLMYPEKEDIYGVICNKTTSKVIHLSEIDTNEELELIESKTAFLHTSKPPKPFYLFGYNGSLSCDSCGYFNCIHRFSKEEFYKMI